MTQYGSRLSVGGANSFAQHYLKLNVQRFLSTCSCIEQFLRTARREDGYWLSCVFLFLIMFGTARRDRSIALLKQCNESCTVCILFSYCLIMSEPKSSGTETGTDRGGIFSRIEMEYVCQGLHNKGEMQRRFAPICEGRLKRYYNTARQWFAAILDRKNGHLNTSGES